MRKSIRCAVGITAATFSIVCGDALAQSPPVTTQPSIDSPPPNLELFGADPGIGFSFLDQQNGEFNHQIAIKVPSYHGIEPKLSLQYASLSGNGFVGVGWHLGGFSVIQRASPGKGAPAYGSSDIFLLDGEELVPCGQGSVSPSCAAGGNYSTKIENYKRIYFDSTANAWTITGKDGTAFTYMSVYEVPNTFRWGLTRAVDTRGNTVNYGWWCDPGADCYPSSVRYNRTAVSFYLEARPDPITFANGSYLGETNYRLKTIDIVVNGSRALAYALTYSSVSPNTGRSLLLSVQQYGKDATLDPTTLAVNTGTALPADALQWMSSPTGIVTNPLYSNADCYGGYCGLALDGGIASGAWWIAGDFNGDGKTDFLIPSHPSVPGQGLHPGALLSTVPASNAALLISTGTGFTSIPLWNAGACYQGYCGMETDQWVVGDFDGDGKTDFIVHNANYGALFKSTGSGFAITWLWQNNTCYQGYCALMDQWTTGDFNGDGKTDFIVHNANQGALFTSTGNGFAITWLWANSACYQGHCGMMDYWTKGDFNGDGKTDFIVHNTSAGALFTANSTGTGFTITWLWANTNCYQGFCPNTFGSTYKGSGLGDDGTHHWIVGDFNGDGKADFIIPGSNNGALFTSTGHGFNMTWLWQNASCFGSFCDSSGSALAGDYPWQIGDFNGDGRTDFIIGAGDSGSVALFTSSPSTANSVGTAFTVTQLDTSTICGRRDEYITSWVSGDFNGDGKSDFLVTSEPFHGQAWIFCDPLLGVCAPVFAYEYVPPSAALCTASGSIGDLVSGLSNGKGGTTAISYRPSTAWPTAHADPSCTPAPGQPNFCPNNPPVRQLVSSVTVNDGQQTWASSSPRWSYGHSATTSHDYSGGYYDRVERRHLGFRYEKQTLPCDNGETSCPYEEIWFHQDYGSVTKPDHIYRSTGAGQLLTSVIYEYATNGATIPYQSLMTGRWDYLYDGTGGQACPGANCRRKYARYSYDNYSASGNWVAGFGNTTRTLEYGDYDVTGDERTTSTTFASPNTSAYIVGLPAVVDVYAGLGSAGQLLSESITYYDNATSWQAVPSTGNATAMARCQDTSLPQAQWTYVVKTLGYDTYGNVTSVADENNNLWSFAYDSTYHQFVTSVTNPLNQSWTAPLSSWDIACQAATQITDPNGQSVVTTLDPLCRPTLLSRPLGGFVGFTYCGLSSMTNQCGTTSGPAAQFTEIDAPSADGNGNQWLKVYLDGRGRAWRASRKGPSTGQAISVDALFGARGKKARQTAPYYPSDTLQWTSYLYDTLDRVLTVTHPDGSTMNTSYVLWSTSVVDELGYPKTDTLDAYGNLVNHQEKLGSSYINTAYTYDLLGDLTHITDAAGNLWTYVFDSLKRTTQVIDPDSGTWTFQYYPNGTQLSQRDAKGQKTSLGYDGVRRVTSMTMLDGTSESSTVGWTYDEVRSGYYNIGQLTTATDGAGTQVLNYDAAGRMVQMTRTISGSSYPFSYGYDAGNRLLWTTYPDGDTVGTAAAPLLYDGAGRLQSIPGIVDAASYDAWDHLVQLNNHNGTASTRTFSPSRGWLTGLATVSGPSFIQNLTYQRDAKGRIVAQTSPSCLEGWSYAYDDLDRLISALNHSDYTQNESYSYDTVGNITYNSRVGPYTYPTPGPNSVLPHAVQTAGGNAYQYDLNGSMVSGAGRSLAYDGLNRLAAVGNVTFTYAADGSRLAKNGSTTTYYVGDDFEMTEGVVTKYIRLGSERVAKRVGTTTYWLHEDHLGSTNVLTDASGKEMQRKKFSAYGDTIQTTTALAETTAFTGERQDETGLLYLHARYYDPRLARFISADPSHPRSRGVGVNRYAYALGNPVAIADHSGLDGLPVVDPFPDPLFGTGAMPILGNGLDDPYVYPDLDVYGHIDPEGLYASGSSSLDDDYIQMLDEYYQMASSTYQQEASTPLGSQFEAVSTGIGVAGFAAESLEPFAGSCSVGSNGVLYTSGWRGNQYVSTVRVGTALKVVGAGALLVGTVLDGVRVHTYLTKGPDARGAMNPAKFGLNLGVGAYGVMFGVAGLPLTGTYFLVDAFYPGGWPAALEMNADLERRNQAILGPSFRLRGDGGP